GFRPLEHQDNDALAVLESSPVDQNGLRSEEYSDEQTAPPRAILVRSPRPDAVRTAVVGVGYLGRFHAQKYARLPEANLVSVVDINSQRGRQVAKEVNTQASTDYRELIGKVDAVSIVTPTPQHFAIAKEFLSAGVHVLLEKPMTKNLEEARELIATATK